MFGNVEKEKPTENVFAVEDHDSTELSFYQKPKFWGILSIVLIVLVGAIAMYHEATKPMTDTAVSPSKFASMRDNDDNGRYQSTGLAAKKHSHFILSDGFHG